MLFSTKNCFGCFWLLSSFSYLHQISSSYGAKKATENKTKKENKANK
jgi:hypothetical protein